MCELSHNLADIISPAVSITAIRNQINGVCIFIDRITTSAARAPAPVEWIEIFHQKFITVTAIARKATVIKKDFIKKEISKAINK